MGIRVVEFRHPVEMLGRDSVASIIVKPEQLPDGNDTDKVRNDVY
jgi:hypothetical protein